MRILPSSHHKEGYDPPSVELNQEVGHLEIAHEARPEIIEEARLVADSLILRCHLRPLPLVDTSHKVQHVSEGLPRTQVNLYQEASVIHGYDREVEWSRWRGIALEYTGIGQGESLGNTFLIEGKNLPEGQIKGDDILYTKPFQVETTDYSLRTRTLEGGHLFVSPPGVLNTQILRGYGGYYKEGLPLEEIQQIYYGVTSLHEETHVRLLSTDQLVARKIPPPLGGVENDMALKFHPDLKPEEYLSLPGALSAGFARVKVSTELGITEFVSHLCEPVLGHPTHVNIHFKP